MPSAIRPGLLKLPARWPGPAAQPPRPSSHGLTTRADQARCQCCMPNSRSGVGSAAIRPALIAAQRRLSARLSRALRTVGKSRLRPSRQAAKPYVYASATLVVNARICRRWCVLPGPHWVLGRSARAVRPRSRPGATASSTAG
jgi:hypothetical protein